MANNGCTSRVMETEIGAVLFAWSALCQSRLVIGQFGCSGLPPSDAKGKPAIESERKNIST